MRKVEKEAIFEASLKYGKTKMDLEIKFRKNVNKNKVKNQQRFKEKIAPFWA